MNNISDKFYDVLNKYYKEIIDLIVEVEPPEEKEKYFIKEYEKINCHIEETFLFQFFGLLEYFNEKVASEIDEMHTLYQKITKPINEADEMNQKNHKELVKRFNELNDRKGLAEKINYFIRKK